MKRKLLIALMIALIVPAAFGCGGKTEKESERFDIVICQDCQDDIYAMSVEYFSGNDPQGGCSVTDAGNGALRGDVYFSFLPDDLPKGIPEEFSFMLSVYGKDDMSEGPEGFTEFSEEPEPLISDTFSPSYGETYRYALTGSREEGYRLEKVTE